jgi:hypothetical protein
VKVDDSCTCPDFKNWGKPCKHILLTQMTLAGQIETDGCDHRDSGMGWARDELDRFRLTLNS